MSGRSFFVAGSVSGAAGVLLGAFAAHALRDTLTPAMVGIFETGVRYQMVHALALFIAGAAAERLKDSGLPRYAGWFFLLGTVLFSGSLYLLALTGRRWLGIVTPLGGIAFVAGWLCLAMAALKVRKEQ